MEGRVPVNWLLFKASFFFDFSQISQHVWKSPRQLVIWQNQLLELDHVSHLRWNGSVQLIVEQIKKFELDQVSYLWWNGSVQSIFRQIKTFELDQGPISDGMGPLNLFLFKNEHN